MNEVAIVTDKDINERIKERAQMLGAYLMMAEKALQARWCTTEDAPENPGCTIYAATSMADIEIELLKGIQSSQRFQAQQYHVVPSMVNQSHTKLIHTDYDGVVYIVGEVFEYDHCIPCEDYNWFFPCVAVVNHLA